MRWRSTVQRWWRAWIWPTGACGPQFSLDASVGVNVYKSDRITVRLQGDVENLNDRLNVIDFAGLFSGNAIGPGRSGYVRLQTAF